MTQRDPMFFFTGACMSRTVMEFEVHDIRFPTSEQLDGSDAMNPDPDYSAAYVVIRASDGTEGHGFCFTVGRGNDVVAAAIEALRRPAPRTAADPAAPVNADLAEIASGRNVAPSAPGFSARMLPESIADHRYPQGPVWRARRIIKEVNS